jgi:hypothetical protein
MKALVASSHAGFLNMIVTAIESILSKAEGAAR